MYGYTKIWENGTMKWVQKTNRKPERQYDLSYDNILTVTLIGCDVKTNVQGVSWKVEHAGVIHRHFSIPSTTSWEVEDNIITINSEDSVPYRLLFISVSEALKADYRLYLIMNGSIITDCGDDIYYKCGRPATATVNFL